MIPDGIQARLDELQKELIRKANSKQDYDAIADEQPHQIMERTHPRHAAPAPGPVPGAADQGGVLVVPPTHRASGTRRAARGQRRHGRTNRGSLPGSPGTQPAGRMADDLHPDAIRHRHRLGQIPHPNQIPRRPRLPQHRTHIWPITLIIIVSMLDGIKAPFPILLSF